MTDTTDQAGDWLRRSAGTPYAYLTTIGRKTGRPHRVEIWFAAENCRLYLMAGGRYRADWVRNLQVNPRVTVELDDATHEGVARIIRSDSADDRRARKLLTVKYATPGNPLDDWKRRSLPVVIEFADSAAPSPDTAVPARIGAPPA